MGLSNPEVRLIRDLQLFADQANFVEPTWLYIRPETRIQFGDSGQAQSPLSSWCFGALSSGSALVKANGNCFASELCHRRKW